MKIFVDIDETVCLTPGNVYEARDYTKATPIKENIKKINELFDKGHEITYWTARGSGTNLDWTEVTSSQLKKWGAKYHNLILKKPIYDLFIDDKVVNTEKFFNNGGFDEYFKKDD